ncbi:MULTISPECIES: hypothetical protein [Actinoplanes]|uniref:hypothetical protein n=1 Tax=Actinoplanes TaxID=1865 RepID=UPI0005F2DE38|nr:MULTISPECIES: hypothetical protein [Actinoplanes]GLY01715.1 hypothetical protein Acsp01_20940 [Actinoplanes sp. NBRC 101535]
MTDEMMRRLSLLHAETARWGDLAATFTASAPRQAEGSDESGRVTVTLGANGLPRSIRVRNDWTRYLRPDRLGSAVMDAATDALRRGMQDWAYELDDRGWRGRLRDVEDERFHREPIGQPRSPAGLARELGELTEDVIRALQTTRSADQEQSAEPVKGTGGGGHVAVVLGPAGLTACTVDAAWAERNSGDDITAALGRALRTAEAAVPAPLTRGPDDLLGTALATLRTVADPN